MEKFRKAFTGVVQSTEPTQDLSILPTPDSSVYSSLSTSTPSLRRGSFSSGSEFGVEGEVFENSTLSNEQEHKQEGGGLEDRVGQLKKENTYLKRQNAELKSHSTRMTEESDMEIYELTEKKQIFEEKVKELKHELKEREKELAGRDQDIEQLEQKVSALEKNPKDKGYVIKILNNQLKDKESGIQLTNKANEELQKKLDQSEAELSGLRAENTELRNSPKKMLEGLEDDGKKQLVELLSEEKEKLTDAINQLIEERLKSKALVEELKQVREEEILEAANRQSSTGGKSLADEIKETAKMQDQGTQSVDNSSNRIISGLRQENIKLTRDKQTISGQLQQKVKEIGELKGNLEQSQEENKQPEQAKNEFIKDGDKLKKQIKNLEIVESDNQLKDKKNDRYYPESSILMGLGLPLTESEENLISEFYKDLSGVSMENDEYCRGKNPTSNALRNIEHITHRYLKKGIILNGGKYIITELVLGKIINIIASHESVPEDTKIISNIIVNLLLRGGRVENTLLYDSKLSRVSHELGSKFSAECKKINDELKSLAYKGIINGNTQGEVLHTEVDNIYFYMRYSQDSIIEVTKIVDDPRIKRDFKCHIFHIGKSVVEVDNTGEKRNYTNVVGGSIEMSFDTEVGKINVYLHPGDKRTIKVELDEESREKFNNLKDKTNLGNGCLLGGKSVLQAIKDGNFKNNVPIKPTEIVRQSNDERSGILPTFMKEIHMEHLQKESEIEPSVNNSRIRL